MKWGPGEDGWQKKWYRQPNYLVWLCRRVCYDGIVVFTLKHNRRVNKNGKKEGKIKTEDMKEKCLNDEMKSHTRDWVKYIKGGTY